MRWTRLITLLAAALSLALACLVACSCGGGKNKAEVSPPEDLKTAAGMQGHKMGQPFTAEELARMRQAAESRRSQ